MVDSSAKIVRRAQEQGFNFSETDEGWHGAYIYAGQEYTLDNADPQALLDDFEALAEILAQDDTYTLEYNDDADRYIVDAEGQTERFTDQVLAKAFQKAKGAVMRKLQEQEAERRKQEEPPKPAFEQPKPLRASKKKQAGNGEPAPDLAQQQFDSLNMQQPEALGGGSELAAVADALRGIRNILEELSMKLIAQFEGGHLPFPASREAEEAVFSEPVIETPPPAPRKKGLGSKKA